MGFRVGGDAALRRILENVICILIVVAHVMISRFIHIFSWCNYNRVIISNGINNN